MLALVTPAYGLIGSALVARLLAYLAILRPPVKATAGGDHEPRAASQRLVRHPAPRLRRHKRVRPWHLPARPAQGHAASPAHRLDLGDPDGRRGGKRVLDPRAAHLGSVEPDPPVVDLHADHVADRCLAGAPPQGAGSHVHDDLDLRRRADHLRHLHPRPRPHHARGRVRRRYALSTARTPSITYCTASAASTTPRSRDRTLFTVAPNRRWMRAANRNTARQIAAIAAMTASSRTSNSGAARA